MGITWSLYIKARCHGDFKNRCATCGQGKPLGIWGLEFSMWGSKSRIEFQALSKWRLPRDKGIARTFQNLGFWAGLELRIYTM